MIAILQFDAASVPLLEWLIAEGCLPTLAGLRDRGRWHTLETPATYFEGAASHTLYSGNGVGEHGLYYPFQWSAAEQRVRFYHDFPALEAVWERIGRAGRRSLVVDPYEARRPQTMAGICLSGWQCTNRVVLQRWSVPHGVHRVLAHRFGQPPAADEVFGRTSASELLRLHSSLLVGPSRAADIATDLLSRKGFDMVWVTFIASHFAGHRFWDMSHLSHQEFDRCRRDELGTAMADVYTAVDGAIGRIVAALPPDADLIVVSPYGMGMNRSRCAFLPGMLQAVLTNGRSGVDGTRAPAGGSLWRLRASVPTGFRAGVSRVLPDRLALELTARLELRGVDWRCTRAFVLPCDHHGYVRLNLRGRERHGIVAPTEADVVMDEIAAGFLTFRDADGGPSVQSVDRASDLFGGVRSHQLPDLIVRWSDRTATHLAGVSSPRYGDVLPLGCGTGRSGAHTDEAWALVVPGASRIRVPTRRPQVVDIAATACALLGADTDGLAGEPLLDAAVGSSGR